MICMIGSEKGGVGKTTIMWHLILELSEKMKGNFKRIQLIDTDKNRKSFLKYKKERKEKGYKTNFEIIPNIYSKKEIFSFYEKYNEKDDLVFIDSAGVDSDLNSICVYLSDILICPTSTDKIDFESLLLYFGIVNTIFENDVKDGKAQKNIFVLFNRIHSSKKDINAEKNWVKDISKHYANINVKVCDHWITQSKGFNEANYNSKMISDMKRDEMSASAQTSFLNVVSEIESYIKEIK